MHVHICYKMIKKSRSARNSVPAIWSKMSFSRPIFLDFFNSLSQLSVPCTFWWQNMNHRGAGHSWHKWCSAIVKRRDVWKCRFCQYGTDYLQNQQVLSSRVPSKVDALSKVYPTIWQTMFKEKLGKKSVTNSVNDCTVCRLGDISLFWVCYDRYTCVHWKLPTG